MESVEGGELWVQRFDGVTSTQLVTKGEAPLSAAEATKVWVAGPPAGAVESGTTDDQYQAMSGPSCSVATLTASLLTGIGGAGLAALAIANPAGLVIGGVFFSASMLNYAALVAGSYAAMVGWLGGILC